MRSNPLPWADLEPRMWTYTQNTGEMKRPDGTLLGTGYSGHDLGRNNPGLERVHETGPIPCGKYTIGPQRDDVKLGRGVMPLTPDPSNEMYGRSGFYIHGNSAAHPLGASHGCIILDRQFRAEISRSEDRVLEVVSGL